MTFEQARELFLSYLEAERGCSHLTIVAYRSDIRQFVEFLQKNDKPLKVEQVETTDIREFIAGLQGKGLSPATIGRRISCLRSLYEFLWTSEYVSRNPCAKIRTPKKQRKLPTVLTVEESVALLDAAYDCHFTRLGFRDRAVLSVLLYTGLRRQELLDLNLDDVDLENGWLRVRKGKGNKTRMVPLVDEVITAIEDWLEFRPPCDHSSLFTTRTKKPLGKHGLQDLFKKALKNAGITRDDVTIHTARHTFATLLLKNGCDLMSIKELLGHESLESTSIYLHVDMSSLRSGVEKHPLSS